MKDRSRPRSVFEQMSVNNPGARGGAEGGGQKILPTQDARECSKK